MLKKLHSNVYNEEKKVSRLGSKNGERVLGVLQNKRFI